VEHCSTPPITPTGDTMTRQKARTLQAKYTEDINFLASEHDKLLEAADKIYRDIEKLIEARDIVDMRLQHDGTSFTGQDNVRIEY